MADQSTQIDFERSGGVVGSTLSVSLDAARLPSEEAAELDRLASDLQELSLAATGSHVQRGADRYQFVIEVHQGGRQVHLTLSEDQIPENFRGVIDRLVDLARRERKRRGASE